MEYNLPLFDEEIGAARPIGYCSYREETSGFRSTWIVTLVIGEYKVVHRFTDPDPNIKPPNAHRRAARACREMSKIYRIPILRPARMRK